MTNVYRETFLTHPPMVDSCHVVFVKNAHLDSHKRGFCRLHDTVTRINLVRIYLSGGLSSRYPLPLRSPT